MSNETPVERFTASRHILENRELVDDYVECVLAADYDKLKAVHDELIVAQTCREQSTRPKPPSANVTKRGRRWRKPRLRLRG